MGVRYIQHSDLCGCGQCAARSERGICSPVFDEIEDPDYLDCGCSKWSNCDCAMYDGDE